MTVKKISNFKPFVCSPDTSIRAVMKRLDVTEIPVIFVVDEHGVPLGAVTDGDVRRAMLTGVSIDAPVTQSMKSPPITASVDNRGEAIAHLEALQVHNPQAALIPLVNAAGHIVALAHLDEQYRTSTSALLMAGGFGKRLGERTRSTPKPLLPVGGRPMLDRILEQLEDAGIEKIFVSVHYLADQIADFIATRANRATIELVFETEPLGTAGAISLLPDLPGGLLLCNGDILTRLDMKSLIAFHNRHDYDATLAVASHEMRIPFGVVRHNDSGLFMGIDEKPVLRHFVAAGIYYLSPSVLPLVGKDRPTDVPELLNDARKLGLKLGLFPIHEYWSDLGRPDDLDQADKELSR